MLLEAGGNAFDAALAGCSACIPQPGWLAPLREDVRVSAMMAPTVAEHSGRLIALDRGSNRLRTASLQTRAT